MKKLSLYERFCSRGTTTKPASRRKCGQKCASASWSIGSWGYCSATCGDSGIQERQVQCLKTSEDNNKKIVVPDSQCDQTTPHQREQACNRIACPGKWRYGSWTACSKTCGVGNRRRQVQCTGSFCESVLGKTKI